jgi:hypothetical protein
MVYGENKDFIERKISKDVLINEIFTCAGWNNKMFVKNELMPHKIKITGIKQCRLQDITDDECLKEGIVKAEKGYIHINSTFNYSRPIGAFANLIYSLNGKGYWESNPLGYAYEFELVK